VTHSAKLGVYATVSLLTLSIVSGCESSLRQEMPDGELAFTPDQIAFCDVMQGIIELREADSLTFETETEILTLNAVYLDLCVGVTFDDDGPEDEER